MRVELRGVGQQHDERAARPAGEGERPIGNDRRRLRGPERQAEQDRDVGTVQEREMAIRASLGPAAAE